MQKHISPWQILFYFSLSVLTLWLILKVAGVIQTPVWLEYGVPIASLILVALAQYQHIIETLAQLVVKVDHLDKDVEMLKQRTAHL